MKYFFYIIFFCTTHISLSKNNIKEIHKQHKDLATDYHYMIQSDGKIATFGVVFSGINYKFLLSRYTSAGQLDSSFGTNGIVTITTDTLNYANVCALQSDGTFIIDGYKANGIYQDFILLRYTTAGTLDQTFGTNGKLIITHTQLDNIITYKRQSDGTFFISGYKVSGYNIYFTLLKYTSAGILDTTFGLNGYLITPIRTIIKEEE